MTFDNAFVNMKKYGGRIRRAKYPNFELTILNGILFTIIHSDDPNQPLLETEIHVSTKDIMADDWELNLIGGFVNENL